MCEFASWLEGRYQERPWLIENYFDPEKWEAELASLLGEYASPKK